jgi:hypothetical protein
MRNERSQVFVSRVGFLRPERLEQCTTPEAPLQALLRAMEAEGHTIVSVSVLHAPAWTPDLFEAYVVSRHDVDDRSSR